MQFAAAQRKKSAATGIVIGNRESVPFPAGGYLKSCELGVDAAWNQRRTVTLGGNQPSA